MVGPSTNMTGVLVRTDWDTDVDRGKPCEDKAFPPQFCRLEV